MYGPIHLPEQEACDTVSILFASRGPQEHTDRISVELQLLTDTRWCLAQARDVVGFGEERVSRLSFDSAAAAKVYLTFAVSYSEVSGRTGRGRIEFRYVLGYKTNPLVEMFNKTGSDKGTECWFGEGVPHAYALDYYYLFRPFQNERFNMLEIGLAMPPQAAAKPPDAPSLRAWREFFPNATLYGFDIEDFSGFSQRDTTFFRGDQASRECLDRFIEVNGARTFRLIVDDGSHASSHQQVSLAALFPYVEPGGLYVIEDLDWQPFEESPTTAEVLGEFRERKLINSKFLLQKECEYLQGAIDDVAIFRPSDSAFAVIAKRQ